MLVLICDILAKRCHPGEYAEMIPSVLIRHRLDNIAHFTQHHLSALIQQELSRAEKPTAVAPISPQEYAEMVPDELIRHHLDNITHFTQNQLSAYLQQELSRNEKPIAGAPPSPQEVMGELLLSHPTEYAEMVPSVLIRHRLDNIAHFTQHHLSAHIQQELSRAEKPTAVAPTSPQEYAEFLPDELIRHNLDNITHFTQNHLSAYLRQGVSRHEKPTAVAPPSPQ